MYDTEAGRAHDNYKNLLYLKHAGERTQEQVDEAFKKWCAAETKARGS